MPVPDFAPNEVLTASAMDQIGLWLVKTQTIGTAVSTQNCENCFSADFDAYRVVVSDTVGSTSQNNIGFQFLPTTASGFNTSYSGALMYVQWATAGLQEARDNNTSQFQYVANFGTNNGATSFDVINPFRTKFTLLCNAGWSSDTGSGTYNGIHRQAVSYTGFRLSAGANTMTGGTIRVYGYRK